MNAVPLLNRGGLFCALQVKIFEEDFRKERSDRERMNEEKEDLRRQVERLQGQMTNLTNQVSRD